MKMKRTGLLVVNRLELLRQAQAAGVLEERQAALEMSDTEVFARYRGFDGLAWPCPERLSFEIQDGLAPIAELPSVEGYLAALDSREECEIIVLAGSDEPAPGMRQLGWQAVGFDLGYFESEWSHYSILLNEVVYGLQSELRSYATKLNSFLLLDSIEEAAQLQNIRRKLFARGSDLEQIACIETIAVMVRL